MVNRNITEAGVVTRKFIDCGGTIRSAGSVNFQVWVADDVGHRLKPGKLLDIISTYEKHFGEEDLDVEMEYQLDTIGRFGLEFQGGNFILTSRHTDCLAPETCGVELPEAEPISAKSQRSADKPAACCTPAGGCC